MNSLDFFSKEGILFISKSSFDFKTIFGSLITIFQGFISLIIILVLGFKNTETKSNFYSGLKGEFENKTEFYILYKYPLSFQY
jgi:hypothetical protein